MSAITCNCGKQADVREETGYWWEVFCKHCHRFLWGYISEMEARVQWIRTSHEEQKGLEWTNFYIGLPTYTLPEKW